MKIAVVGAGGVGTFYGALLQRAGHDVHFLARGPQRETLRSRGIRIASTQLGEITIPPVPATDRAEEIGEANVVLVCVKAHQTEAILDAMAPLVGDRTLIVPLQNGVETDEVLASRFGRPRVPVAVVYVGATLDAPGVVSHVANGLILLGASPGFDAARLPELQQALATTGLPVRISDDIQADRWRKLIWNASFNPVSAMTQKTPGELLADPESRPLLRGLMQEVVAVAQAQGLKVSEKEIDDLIEWTAATPSILTSMLVDRERGRAMETDALVGVVVRKGRDWGVPTPLSESIYKQLGALDARRP